MQGGISFSGWHFVVNKIIKLTRLGLFPHGIMGYADAIPELCAS